MALSLNFLPVRFQQTMDEAFPAVEPGVQPFGQRVLVQLRTAKRMTKPKEEGGIELTEETRETVAYNTQVAKVIAVGPLAFKNRTTMQSWPEGSWAAVGDFVRVGKYGGDRWERPIPGTHDDLGRPEQALFMIVNDLDIIGKITADPRDILAFI
jgi:co-chaperonin GroES (HSP10)